MIPHEIKMFLVYSTIAYFVKKFWDLSLSEADKERRKIVKAHVSDSHKESLKTCSKGDCGTSLQSPGLMEHQVQELSHQ